MSFIELMNLQNDVNASITKKCDEYEQRVKELLKEKRFDECNDIHKEWQGVIEAMKIVNDIIRQRMSEAELL